MLTSVARINIYSSSQRLTRSLLSSNSIPSNPHQYYHSENQTTQPQTNHYLINHHSWKLTHQPREPSLHWNPRFRQQQFQAEEKDEEDQSSDNWDSWFQQHQSPSLLPFSQRNNLFSKNQVYFLDLPHCTTMPKRSRDWQSPNEIPNKREKYSHCKFLNISFLFNLKPNIF
jgi:hypothetical protein